MKYKPPILPNKNRRCIFTGIRANRHFIMGEYPDKHSQIKRVPTCDEYLHFREQNLNWRLQLREREIFTLYWQYEFTIVFNNVNQIDFGKLEKLQNLNLEEMAKFRGDFDIDSFLEKKKDEILSNFDLETETGIDISKEYDFYNLLKRKD